MEHTESPQHSTKKAVNVTFPVKTLALAGAVVVLLGISFYAGSAWQKQHNNTAAKAGKYMTAYGPRAGMGMRGGLVKANFSDVTAISSSSITVTLADGTSKTYNVTNNTVVVKGGAQVAISTVAVGDRVQVVPSSSDSSTAASIMVGPSFGNTSTNTLPADPQSVQIN